MTTSADDRIVDHVELNLALPPDYLAAHGEPKDWPAPATDWWDDREWETFSGMTTAAAIDRARQSYLGLDTMGVGCAIDIVCTDGTRLTDVLGVLAPAVQAEGGRLYRAMVSREMGD